jgi:20S proteasome subunit alpha 6
MVSQQKDREQFLKSCFYQADSGGEEKKEHNMDNVVEILLRLIRGDRLLIGSNPGDFHHHHHHHHYHHNSANNSVHPTLQAAVGSDPSLLINQTHSSLAVLAMFRVLQQTATKYGGEEAKKDVEGRVKEIVKCLPQHMINKSLDGMFQKWSAAATQGSSKPGGSIAPAKAHR